MDENTVNVQETTAVEPEQTTEAQQATGTTQPQAETVDIEKLLQRAESTANSVAEKKAQQVFHDMLKQQGFDAQAIRTMTAEWQANRRTPEQELAEARKAAAQAEADKVKVLEQLAAIGKGIPADKADKYLKLAEAYQNDDTNLAAALDLALADFPLKQQAPPPYAAGTGAQAMSNEDVLKNAIGLI